MPETKSGAAGTTDNDKPDTLVIPIVEEEARIAKRRVVNGKVIVKTTVDTEERVVKEMLSEETVEVERIKVNRVVEKQLFLVEEVRILEDDFVRANLDVPVTLRKERATERLNGSGEPNTE